MKTSHFPLVFCLFFQFTNEQSVQIPNNPNRSRPQRVQAQGRLFCGTIPAVNVTVTLVDIDFGIDDEMDRKRTNDNGVFLLDGSTSETTTVEPMVKIYHDCDDYLPCQRLWKITIPEKYVSLVERINGGEKIKKFDFGTLNLEVRIPDETHDCIAV